MSTWLHLVHFDPIRLQPVQSISQAQPLANQTRTSDPEAESDCYQQGLEASTASCSRIPMRLICLTCLPVHFIHSPAPLSLNTTCGELLPALTNNNNPSLRDFVLQAARIMTQHQIVIDQCKSGKNVELVALNTKTSQSTFVSEHHTTSAWESPLSK